MDVGEDPELALDIPIRSIYEEFCCPICFGAIQECMITPCGHNFCSGCILECLNRKHTCPCCNKPTVKENLIKNHHFDKLVEIITEQKDLASKKYFDKLIKKPAALENLTESQERQLSVNENTFSPIEKIFHKHMKKSLINYEDYYKDIQSKFLKSSSSIRSDFTNQLAQITQKYERKKRRIISKEGGDEKKLEQAKQRYETKSARLQKKCNDQISQLERSFKDSENILLELYDKYMEGFAPTKQFLPVVVSVRLVDKDILLKNVTISRTDSLNDVKANIQRRLAENGNPLDDWGKNAIFILRAPFVNATEESHDEDIIIVDESRPLVQYNAQQGGEIIIKGSVKLESDKPKMCFTATYTPGAITDYFSCKDCNINWVCKECAENCHKGHKIVEHYKQHKPTWNCCYCVKRKKCTIVNKTSKT